LKDIVTVPKQFQTQKIKKQKLITGPDLVANDCWKETSKRSYKKLTKGKIELRNSFKNQITTINQYAALEPESNTPGEEFNLETVLVNKTKAISTRQLRNKIHIEQDF
jgi:hypothetical protein